MAFIYWKSENVEIQLLFCFPFQNQHFPWWAITKSSITNIIIFPAVIFPSFAACQVPNHQDSEDIARGSSCQNSSWFWYSPFRRRARGRGGEPICLFSMPGRGQCPDSDHLSPSHIPSQGASVGHGLPLASTARAPLPQLPLNEPPEPFQLSRQEESGSVLRVMTHN